MKKFLHLCFLGLMASLMSCNTTPQQKITPLDESCAICNEPMEAFELDSLMECTLCHQQELGTKHCSQGHYICSNCLEQGLDTIIRICLSDTTTNAVALLEKLMSLDCVKMHGPIHHVLGGSALLTAYHNASGKLDLPYALVEMISRGKQIPGGACGSWGACGASISMGIVMSIITQNTPFSTETWRLCNATTAKALEQVSSHGGPRCCKRDSYLSILTAIDCINKEFGTTLEKPQIQCSRSSLNQQCIGTECPFFCKQ